jgi:aminoglycoside phosphotransferase (APT) family kinase protein
VAADACRRLLDDPAALAEDADDCFVHGDCHAANLLLDGDRIVWADWQSTGSASPAGDLALL